MTRGGGFAHGIVFGALAAIGSILWAMVAAPIVGGWRARVVYLIGVTVLYVAALGSDRARALGAATVAAVAAAAIGLAARSTAELALGLAAILGVARSGFLCPAPAARAAIREIVLLLAGLGAARFLTAASFPSTALALWGFFLVQSFFFLGSGTAERLGARPADPFDEVHRRAVALLGS